MAMRKTSNASSNGVDAAAALDLLECDPSSLVWPTKGGGGLTGQGRPGGRREKSAAQLAREQYEAQAQARQAWQAPVDLLDLDSPAQASTSVTSGTQLLDMGQDGGGQRSGAPLGRGLWPGDVVFARYGPNGNFFRAKVVRVYSSRGSSLADVEWLRPQAGCGTTSQFVCSTGLDETLHGVGLQVGVDTQSFNSAGVNNGIRAPTMAPVGAPPPPLTPLAAPAGAAAKPAATASAALPSRAGAAGSESTATVTDLLDLQADDTPDLLGGDAVLSDAPGGYGGGTFPSLQSAMGAGFLSGPVSPTATGGMAGSATATSQGWNGLGHWPQQQTQFVQRLASQQERSFGFVSDMISQASHSSAANMQG